MPIAFVAPEPIRRQPGRYLEILEQAGFTVVFPEGPSTVTREQLLRYLPEADVAMAGGEVYSADLLALAPKLKVIARTGVGYDAVDVPASTARGIAVTIAPGTNQESVAEQAFALLLGLTRRLALNDRLIRAGGWDRTLPKPLRGKTIGLLGMGRIGRAMVPRAQAFGLKVIAFDPMPPSDAERQMGVVRVSFDELLSQADIVSLHLPATEETRGLFCANTFARMKPGALFLNTARGGLVVEPDLIEALKSGQVAGAGLDVFDPEPPRPDNPLLQLPNVVSSPHVAGIDEKSMADMAELAARCMVEVYQGRWPVDCMVNPELAGSK
jgi:phosphoglycerate dehydrogenase-like enzyme